VVEAQAGSGSGFGDADYVAAGARIVPGRDDVWQRAQLIVKVKEPLPPEYDLFQPEQVLFTYLHLAGVDPELTSRLLARRVTAIAYETVQAADGRLPLLAPMSAIAGRLAVQVGAHYLERTHGGSGVLLGSVPGVRRGQVVIVGGGTVGRNAAQIACGLGASVLVLDVDVYRLTDIERLFPSVETQVSTPQAIADALPAADLLLGAVLVTGARAPEVVSEAMVRSMPAGSVIVDVAVDQGGCVETIHPTTHSNPVYCAHDVLHYAVPNMPGAVPHTSTLALTNATLPYICRLADRGLEAALAACPELAAAVNTHAGEVVHPALRSATVSPHSA
jgi:alanine dehydrogenase